MRRRCQARASGRSAGLSARPNATASSGNVFRDLGFSREEARGVDDDHARSLRRATEPRSLEITFPRHLAAQATHRPLIARANQQAQSLFDHRALRPRAAAAHRLPHQAVVDVDVGPHVPCVRFDELCVFVNRTRLPSASAFSKRGPHQLSWSTRFQDALVEAAEFRRPSGQGQTRYSKSRFASQMADRRGDMVLEAAGVEPVERGRRPKPTCLPTAPTPDRAKRGMVEAAGVEPASESTSS